MLLSAALVVGGGGAAFAYWTASGTGTGSAGTGTSTAFTVTSTTAAGGPLTPDGASQSVAFAVHNPGTGSQTLNAVAVTVATSDGTPWAVTGCSAADYSVGTPTFTPGTIAAGGTLTGSVTLSMVDTGSNQDACKGATVPLYFVAS